MIFRPNRLCAYIHSAIWQWTVPVGRRAHNACSRHPAFNKQTSRIRRPVSVTHQFRPCRSKSAPAQVDVLPRDGLRGLRQRLRLAVAGPFAPGERSDPPAT